MAIEGPLRELGMHDVFQLLDLSRKTGRLTVTSALRDNEGVVYFDRGAVVFASIRANPHRLGEMLLRAGKITAGDLERARALQEGRGKTQRMGEILVEMGALSRRELERQVRFQVEEVVFELTSWNEGYFSFEESPELDAPAEAAIRIPTESLLMEGARRIDEWSRIERRVAHPGVVPRLAPERDEAPAMLDLLPAEWEVLAEIDGARDLRAIAQQLVRSEFDVAKIVYGLVTTGIVELSDPTGPGSAQPGARAASVAPHLERARAALEAGDSRAAGEAARLAVAADPASAAARVILARVLSREGAHADALVELRRAASLDALEPAVHLELGFVAAAQGALREAVTSWGHYLGMAPGAGDAGRVRAAAEAATRLATLVEEHVHG